jgi:regulator of protease activity HflC (stomatin/prohibitin superfamily)
MRHIILLVCLLPACAETIQPGHRGLYFDGKQGLQHEVLNPGRYTVGPFGRIDDFDVTYSTHKEQLQTTSAEGLKLDLRVAVFFRPVISELYELDTEIGPNYYEEVIGPEFRSAARGVLAIHSYLELQKNNEKIENEIETELRRRTGGKHLEISSVILEEVAYAPEISLAVQQKLVGEQEAIRQKAALENEAVRQKTSLQNDSLRKKLELENLAEQARIRDESALRETQRQIQQAKEQQNLNKLQAETEAATRVMRANAESQERILLARAHAEERRAESAGLTQLSVMMHAYDALSALGGHGTHIMLGDWSHIPNFLFPRGALQLGGDLLAPQAAAK